MRATVAGVLLLFAGAGASLLVGDLRIKPATAWEALIRYDPHRPEHLIVRDGRLPRAVADVLVGASLAVAGALMQAVTRNPLASPGIMGLNAGASFVTVLTMFLWPTLTRLELIAVSIMGATLGATLVYGLGSLSPAGLTPVRLALTGIAVSALLGAISNGLTILQEKGQDVLFWLARGTDGIRWADVGMVAPLAALGLVGAVALARDVGVLSLGESVALGLGQRAGRAKLLVAGIVLVLAGGAVSLAGPVGFVGLIIPHVVSQLTGTDYRRLIPGCALFGAALMLLADLGARLATTPLKTPVPVGVVTALIGVPFLLYLVRRRPRTT